MARKLLILASREPIPDRLLGMAFPIHIDAYSGYNATSQSHFLR